MKTQDYHINVFYSKKDKCYVADIPDLKYCTAFGDTPQEALKEVIIAKKIWLQTAKEEGMKIPLPKYKAPYLRSRTKSSILKNTV
jgi:predicted RNase H-like HicB family nuclease